MVNHQSKKVKSRQEKKEETYHLILKTAKKLFLEKGYKQTTMRDIAKHANIAIGTTFAHFPDKASLLAATLHNDVEDIAQKSATNAPTGKSVIEILEQAFRPFFEHFANISELTQTWIKETMFMKGEWGEKFNEQFQQSKLRLQSGLQFAQDQGYLIKEADCEVLSTAIMSHYYFVLITGHGSDLDVKAQMALFRQLISTLLFGYIVQNQSNLEEKK